jgi:hypothetical protein
VKTKGSIMMFVEFETTELPSVIVDVILIVVLSETFSERVEGIVICDSLLLLPEFIIESMSESHLSFDSPPDTISYLQEYKGLSDSVNPDPATDTVVFLHLHTLGVYALTVTNSFLMLSHLLVASFQISEPSMHFSTH